MSRQNKNQRFTPKAIDTELVEIDSIHQDPNNSKRHPEKQLEKLMALLTEYGQQRAILVQRSTRKIIAGNGTHRAAKRNNWTHINVEWSDLTDVEATAYGIADNVSGDYGEYDYGITRESLLAIQAANVDVPKVTALDSVDVEKIINQTFNVKPEKPIKRDPEHDASRAKNIAMTPDMRADIEPAIMRIRAMENDPNITEGHALQLISIEWLQSQPSLEDIAAAQLELDQSG